MHASPTPWVLVKEPKTTEIIGPCNPQQDRDSFDMLRFVGFDVSRWYGQRNRHRFGFGVRSLHPALQALVGATALSR